MHGKSIESTRTAPTITGLVFPNWAIPKNVATVFGNDVMVVIMVRYRVTSVSALIEKLILLLTVERYALIESERISL